MKRYIITHLLLNLFLSVGNIFSQVIVVEKIQITQKERFEYQEEVKNYITESYYDILSEAVLDSEIHGNIIDYLMAEDGPRYKPEFSMDDGINRYLNPTQYLLQLHSTYRGNNAEDLKFIVTNLKISKDFYSYGLRGCYVSADYDLEVRNQNRSLAVHRCRMYCLFPNRLFKKEIRALQVEPIENLLSRDSKVHTAHGTEKNPIDIHSTPTENNDAKSQFNLGVRCYKGDGVVQNYKAAVEFFRRAAAQGHVKAMAYLGKCYMFGDGISRDFQESATWYRKAAEKGDVVSQYTIGILYTRGVGIKRNLNEALKWIRNAAEQGNIAAQVEMGSRYENGTGVSIDYHEAARWYRKAVELGDGTALEQLAHYHEWGQGVQKDLKEAVALFRASADVDCFGALYSLGRLFYQRNVHIRDYTIPLEIRKKAIQGNVIAQRKLAHHYFFGIGTASDFDEAAKWYKKAADQGDAVAQFKLALCYEFATGVVLNKNESIKWYRKAAEQGHAAAQFNLGVCYYDGSGVVKDYQEASKWFRKSIEQNLSFLNDVIIKLKRMETFSK